MTPTRARSSRPRVLFDLRWIRSARPDGIGRYALELFRALAESDEGRSYEGLYRDEEIRSAVLGGLEESASFVRAPHGLFSPANAIALTRVLRRRSCRFFVAPNYLGFPAGRAPGTIRIAVVHDLIPWELPEARAGNLRWRVFYRCGFLGHRLLRAPDHLVAVSERTREALVSRFGVERERISVVPGAPSALFQPEGEGDEAVLARIGLRAPYLLYVGRGDRHKNLGRLIEAHRRLPGALRERFPLVIAGTDPGASDPLVRALSGVSDAELAALYRSAAFLVLPSLAEGFGLPLVEAFACGTPALVSRIAPLTEIGGEGARFFDPENVDEIAVGLLAAIEDDARREAMRRAALERARAFTWEKSAGMFAEVLERLDRSSPERREHPLPSAAVPRDARAPRRPRRWPWYN
ncbi:MAG: glycosyltransferase family 1 protein [Candidatus Eisenbacteria bacterium]